MKFMLMVDWRIHKLREANQKEECVLDAEGWSACFFVFCCWYYSCYFVVIVIVFLNTFSFFFFLVIYIFSLHVCVCIYIYGVGAGDVVELDRNI